MYFVLYSVTKYKKKSFPAILILSAVKRGKATESYRWGQIRKFWFFEQNSAKNCVERRKPEGKFSMAYPQNDFRILKVKNICCNFCRSNFFSGKVALGKTEISGKRTSRQIFHYFSAKTSKYIYFVRESP